MRPDGVQLAADLAPLPVGDQLLTRFLMSKA
jgi:hypothetical protein